MKKLISLLQISVVLSLATPFITNARDLTWTGAASGNWNDSANFSPMFVPTANDTVTIDAASNHPRLTTNASAYRLVLLDDTFDLNGYQLNIANEAIFSGGWLVDGQLECRGTIATFAGTVINAAVDVDCTTLELNGSMFNQSCYFKAETGESQGGNTFMAPVSLVHVGTAGESITMTMDQGDTFHDTLYVSNNSDGNIHLTQADTSYFKNCVHISSTGDGSIHFGREGGISILETSGHLVVENGEFTAGQLFIKNIEQQNATGHRMVLTGTGSSDEHSLLALESCHFTGEVDFTAPNLLLTLNRFDGEALLTKTGGYDNVSTGDNLFSADASFTNSSTTGHLLLTGSREDRFLGTAQFTSGSTRVIAGYGATAIFEGDVVVNASTVGFYRMKFTGEAEQALSGTAPHLYGETELDKASGSVTATIPIAIDRRLTFTKGYLATDSVNLITFLAGATASGATDSSFISGPVKKVGNTAFEFPVGKDGDYRPIAMSAPDSITDVFVAEYRSDSMDVNTSDRDTTLGRILRNKYWNLFQHTGSSGVYITLSWNSNHWISDTNVTVAAWSGALWQNLGRGSMTGDSLSGTITSAIEAVHYYQFAIAYERSTGLYLSNNCFNITDGAQLQYCLNHSGNGDILNITTDIILPDVSGPAGTISYPLVVGNGVLLQGYHNGNDTKWWEVGCPLITSGFKAIYNDQKLSDMFLFGLEPGAIFRGLRVRGGSCHYQDYNMDAFLCGGIILMSDNSLPDASISNCEISCFSYAGIFKGDEQGDLNLENNYIHKVKGKGLTTGIGYGVWTMGHDNNLSIINFDNNLFDDCKAAIDGQGDPMDWNILNCTFSQFFYSEDINKHNYNLFTMDKCPCQGTATINNYWDYLGSASNGATYHGSFWEIAVPCVAANCTIPITTYPGHDFGPLYHGSLSSSTLYNGLQGIPFYDVGGANTDIRNCIFHKRWSIDLNGNINLPYPNLDNSRHGNIQNKISIENNTFATDKFDKDIVLSQNMNNSGFAKIADNYILADVWSADVVHIMEGGNSFGYRPGTAVTATAPQPYNFSMQLMNDAATDPLETSYSLSATGGHQYIQHVEKNEPFKIKLDNTLNTTGLTYIIRPNPQQGPSGTTPGVLSTDNYFHQGEYITNNTTVSLPAISTTGLYGIDVLAIDANDQDPTTGELYDFKGSEWKHIPVIVKDDSEDQVLYFNIKDSFLEANQQTATGVMKQAYLNNQLLWEEDIADGGDGWEYVRVDLKDNIPGSSNSPYLTVLHTNGAPNVLSFRISTGNTPVDADMVHGVKVWVDDVYLKKTGSLTGDNLIRDGSVEIISQEELGTGVSLEPLWFRNTTDDFACTNYSRSSAVFISSTDRRSGSQAILLEMPEIFDICPDYPTNVSVSAGTVIDFTDLLSCGDYTDFGFIVIDPLPISTNDVYYQNAVLILQSNIVIPFGRTLTFEGCRIVVRPNNPPFTVTINLGGTLNISPGTFRTHIFACDEMWGGIINLGGVLDANSNSVNIKPTRIEDADIAVSSTGGEVRIRYAEFNDNFIGIELINYNQTHSLTATDKGFLGLTFTNSGGVLTRFPHEGDQPLAHIDLFGVSNVIIGGVGSPNPSSFKNKFSDAIYGIRSVNSTATIINNEFNHLGFESNTCKLCDGAIHATESNLTIGGPLTGSGGNVNYRNYFKKGENGIVNMGEATSVFQGNSFMELSAGIINSGNFNSDITINKDNSFVTVENGIIVREFTGNLLISGNTFNELGFVPNPPLSYSSTAITIQNSWGGTLSNIRVSGNAITDCRIGIHARNNPGISIGADLSGGTGNTISFSKEKGGYQHGIWIENCPDAKIQENEIYKNEPGFSVEGITVYESTGVLINGNVITETDVPVNLFGLCSDTEFHCNTIDNSSTTGAGILMNSATLPDQGSFTNTWDNRWFGYNNTNGGVTGVAASFFDWYYRNTPPEYEPFPNASLVSAVALSNFTGDACQVQAVMADPDREARYGSTAANTLNFADYAEEFTYKSKQYVYDLITKDTSLLTRNVPGDTIFRNFYNSIHGTNIGLFNRVDSLLGIGDLNGAYEMNSSLSDTNLFESNLKSCNAILISKILIDSALSATDSVTLYNIAVQDPLTGGRAVYMARAMLFMEVNQELPTYRIADPSNLMPANQAQQTNMLLVPNPANETCTVYFEHLASSARLLLINGLGQITFQSDLLKDTSKLELPVRAFIPGLYIVLALEEDGVVHRSKLMISR